MQDHTGGFYGPEPEVAESIGTWLYLIAEGNWEVSSVFARDERKI